MRRLSQLLASGFFPLLAAQSLCGGVLTTDLTIGDLRMESNAVSFTIAGTIPFFRPGHDANSFYFTNPNLRADPGFAENGVFFASSINFTGTQALRFDSPVGTGVRSYGDYFFLVFENEFQTGETLAGRVTARWNQAVLDPNQVSALDVYWGAGGPPRTNDGRLTEGIFLGRIGVNLPPVVPEPASGVLASIAALGLLARRPRSSSFA